MNKKPTVSLLTPQPDGSDGEIITFYSQALTIAALLVGPAPQGTPVRSKEYIQKIEDARDLVAGNLLDLLHKTKEASLFVKEDPNN